MKNSARYKAFVDYLNRRREYLRNRGLLHEAAEITHTLDVLTADKVNAQPFEDRHPDPETEH